MRCRIAAGRPAVAGLLLAAGSGHAQVSAEGMGKVLPVELYICTYNDGQGPADLDKVIYSLVKVHG
ncbi:MAG: hypothetical protein WD795_13415 [Woeseia sp.]